jgi:hypothetical protein
MDGSKSAATDRLVPNGKHGGGSGQGNLSPSAGLKNNLMQKCI